MTPPHSPVTQTRDIMPPGLLISAPASGSGKTTVALGLMHALTADGIRIQPFKSGPDYIDPAFHARACGRPSYNLDSWAMGEALFDAVTRAALGADLGIAEGSMGLFDGVAASGAFGRGSSAETAARLGWPVVLVLNVGGQAQSAAATALGFRQFQPDLPVAGVILNNVASPRHEKLLRAGMSQMDMPVFGALPRRPDVTLPERHLGLVQAGELTAPDARIEALGALVRDHVDLSALRAAAAGRSGPAPAKGDLPRPPAQRIAIAQDAAFSFAYPHQLAGWRASGATLLPFSPLADEAPDPSADLVWLPGGYPELHAGRLASARRFREGLRRHAETKQVHGECGGYMALGAGLIDAEGTRHEMAGLLGLETSFAKRKLHLGYRDARLVAPMPGADAGARLRGHEFHYATILGQPDAPLAEVRDAEGRVLPDTGSVRGHVSGSFFHLIAEDAV